MLWEGKLVINIDWMMQYWLDQCDSTILLISKVYFLFSMLLLKKKLVYWCIKRCYTPWRKEHKKNKISSHFLLRYNLFLELDSMHLWGLLVLGAHPSQDYFQLKILNNCFCWNWDSMHPLYLNKYFKLHQQLNNTICNTQLYGHLKSNTRELLRLTTILFTDFALCITFCPIDLPM